MEDIAGLYQRHAEAVLRYHYRRTGCPQTAADLTAETFAAAYASRKRFRDVGAPAQAWLLTIARRQLSHFIRHEKVRDKVPAQAGGWGPSTSVPRTSIASTNWWISKQPETSCAGSWSSSPSSRPDPGEMPARDAAPIVMTTTRSRLEGSTLVEVDHTEQTYDSIDQLPAGAPTVEDNDTIDC